MSTGYGHCLSLLEKTNTTDVSRVLVVWFGEGGNRLAHGGTTVVGETALEAEMRSAVSWDAVIALGNTQRFYDTCGPQKLAAFARWARTCSAVLFIEPRYDFIDAGAFDLGPHRVPLEFESFRFISETLSSTSTEEAPILVLSDHLLWDGKKWHEARSVEAESLLPPRLSWNHIETPPRTLSGGDGCIIKMQVSSPNFFGDNSVAREAAALRDFGPTIRAFSTVPEVLHATRGHAVSIIVRKKIEGSPVEFPATEPLDRRALFLAQKLVTLACHFASAGLFHNDFRPWNILDTSEGLAMIDFADCSRADLDVRDLPQTVALAGSLFLVLGLEWREMKVEAGESFDTDTLAIVETYLSEREGKVSDFYGQSWLDLPQREGRLHSALALSAEHVLTALFAASGGETDADH